jgi:hypothetical protein
MRPEPLVKTPSPVRGETDHATAKAGPTSHPSGSPGGPSDERVVEALERIHHQLERSRRRERQYDFSSLRLLAALLQMLAIVTVLWGVVALLDDQAAMATGRIALGCFLQLASLTAFLIDHLR